MESRLTDYLPETEEESRVLYEAMKYSLMAGGKRLRPVLLLEACSVCWESGKVSETDGDLEKLTGKSENAGTKSGSSFEDMVRNTIPYACAIEFIHTYSLIHDDHPSMDNDDYRRGKLTNHKVFGDDIAILAGDGLLNSAFDIMLEDLLAVSEAGGRTERRLRAAAEISRAAGVHGMVAGQAADVKNTGKERVINDSQTLLYIHKNKTGSLIRAAVRAGAILGGASEEQLGILTKYAENLGLAFQITDDILDVTGDEAELGKRTGTDEQLGKLTYPSVFGLEESRRRLSEATKRAVSAARRFGGKGAFLSKLALDLQERIA